MTLTIKCFTCGDQLEEQGALIFTPPNEFDECEKMHLCKRCWDLSHEHYFKKLRINNISHRNKQVITTTAEGKTKLQSLFIDMLNKKIIEAQISISKYNKPEDVGFLYGLHEAKGIYEESTK